MSDQGYYQLMATYNKWTNGLVYEVCTNIPDEVRRKNCGVFYKSIHGTLNHLVHADQIWLARFSGQPIGHHPFGVDLYDDFDELRGVRAAMDMQIVDWVDRLTDDWLLEPFTFTSVASNFTQVQPAWMFVTHMFNHQIHHRGQLTTLITQLGFEAPALDLPLMPRSISG